MNLKTFNVENSFPSLDEARRMVLDEIRKSKREGVRVLKIIHGYGSSGRGGALHHGLRKSFALRKKEGVIKEHIPGEAFTIFNPVVLELLEAVPGGWVKVRHRDGQSGFLKAPQVWGL